MRGSKRALVVVDMPFGSYEASKEQAFMSAARVMKETGCGAIKLEGGRRMAETIAFLVERGVPVMGHVGLTPQSINTLGSFRAQGRDEADWGRSRPTPGRWRRPARSRGDRGGGRAAGPPDHGGGRRFPPSASGPARPATARSWCSRTCSGSRRGCPSSSSATANLAPRSRLRWRTMPGMFAPAPSPAPSTSIRPDQRKVGCAFKGLAKGTSRLCLANATSIG